MNLSIKNRLRISSLLMMLILMLVGCGAFFAANLLYFDSESLSALRDNPAAFYQLAERSLDDMKEAVASGNEAGLPHEAAAFNERNAQRNLFLAIYKDGVALTPAQSAVDGSLIVQALERDRRRLHK